MRFHADELSCSMGSFGRVEAVVSGSSREFKGQLVGEANRTGRIVLFTMGLSQGNYLPFLGYRDEHKRVDRSTLYSQMDGRNQVLGCQRTTVLRDNLETGLARNEKDEAGRIALGRSFFA